MRRRLSLTIAMAALAAPVAAQDTDTLCGVIGAMGTWIGDGSAGSDLAGMATPVDQVAMLPQGRSQVSLFTLGTPATVRLEAAPQAGGDTEIELYDAQGNLIRTDDDGGGGLASRIDMALEAGTYCLVTRGLGGSAVSADVRLGLAEHPALTGGIASGGSQGVCDATTQAQALGDGPVDGQLDDGLRVSATVQETPYLRFTLAEPAAVTVTARNENADPVVTLYDESGSEIAHNDDFDGLNAKIDVGNPLAPGSYCIALDALSDTSAPIEVTLRRFDPAQALLDLYAMGEASPPLDGPVPVEDLGTLPGRIQQDAMVGSDAVWFSFQVPAAGVVMIDAVGLGDGDPEMFLFDGLGSQIGHDDDGGEDWNARLTVPVLPGAYMVGMRNLGGSGASAAMRLSVQRFVPAD
jgi:hypothetical protein